MAVCKLLFKEAKKNSFHFLESQDAVDVNGIIQDKQLFDEAINQLEQETIQAYGIPGKHWFENPLADQSIIPNEEVFTLIDEKRKVEGLYEDQISGAINTKQDEQQGSTKRNIKRISVKDFTETKKTNIGSENIGEYIFDGIAYRFQSVTKPELKNPFGSKLISQTLNSINNKDRNKQSLDNSLEQAWLQRNNNPEDFVETLGLATNNYLKTKYGFLNTFTFRISSHPGGGVLFFNPRDKTIDFNINKAGLWINYNSLEDVINNIDITLLEEVIHSIANSLLTEQNYKDIFNELSSTEKEIVSKYYLGKKSVNNIELGDRQLVDEYLRLILQDKLFGVTTEDSYRLTIVESLYKFFKKLLNELVSLFDKRIDDSLIKQSVSKIENVLLNKTELYQLPSNLQTEITPELYDQLVAFTKKLNPDFKIEVLDDLLSRKGANGVAQIKNWTIQLQSGKESALLEEGCHVFFELLPLDNPLRKTMMSDVTHTRLYKEIRNNPDYKKVYGNNVDLFKREVAAKLISLYLTDKQLFNHYVGSNTLIDSFIRWIKDFFRWIKGQSKSIGSFIDSAEQIINLDTSNLVLDKLQDIDELYQLGDFIKEATTLKSVGIKGLETKWYDKIYVNISDTLFDINSYDFGGQKKEIMLDKNMISEREQFYKNVPLTVLGKELKDKIEHIGANKVVVYTRMYDEPALIERIKSEFGNVQLIRTDVQSFIEDINGKIVKETTINKFEDTLKSDLEDGVKFVVIDNSKLNFENKDFQKRVPYWNYNNNTTRDYEDFQSRLNREKQSKQNIKRIETLVAELKLVDKETNIVSQKIKSAFAIILGEERSIERLEERLKRMGIAEEDYTSVFKNESGDLLLPVSKARLMKKLLEELDNYEKALIEFVGTLEAVTAFFKERNLTNFQPIRDLIERGTPQDIDNAIQELAQITRMGNHWQEYIRHFREYISNIPDTQTVGDLLAGLDNQINRTKNIAREISKQAIGNKLDKEFESYNANANYQIEVFTKQLEKTSDENEKETLKNKIKEQQSRIIGAEDIIDILNGDVKDIGSIGVWIKTLYNSGDPLIGSISKILQRYSFEVETKIISKGQELGEKVRSLQQQFGITDEDLQNKILTEGFVWVYEGEGDNRKLVRKPRLELLNRYQNMDKRFEMLQPVNEARKKWIEARDNHVPSNEIEDLKRDYLQKKKEFESWETINWYREYTPEYYNRYNELKQTPKDESLFEEVVLIQTIFYNQIEDLARQSEYINDTEGLKLINEQIEDLKKQLKQYKKEVDREGNPKTGTELALAKMFQAKSAIDKDFHEYKSDNKKFRKEFLTLINTVQMDDVVRANLAMLAQTDENYSELYNYAKTKAPYQIKQWLDLNTVNKIDPLWYEQRKAITNQISEISLQLAQLQGIDISTDLNKKWDELFTLTSDLRDEDGIFDGTDASPMIQSKVKDLEKDIEYLKRVARENKEKDSIEAKKLKKQLRQLIKQLNEIQSKKVTNAYIEEFIEFAIESGFSDALEAVHSDIVIDTNSDPLVIINSLEFQQFIEDNPEHPFSIWFNNNHLEKTKFNEFGEESVITEPTYIWYKIEPKDPKRILTVPSLKYSVRKLKDIYHTPKTDLTYHPLFKWFPKSAEFFNPEYTRLMTSSNPKDRGIAQILKLITDYHLETQMNTGVYEARLGFGLPYIQRQNFEGDITSVFDNLFDKRNRFEEGEANFDESNPNEEKFKLRGFFNGFFDKAIDWISGQEKEENTTNKIMRVAVPYTRYTDPKEVTKDALLSVIMFSATTHRADRMMKSVPLFNLIEDTLQNPSTTDSKGRIKNTNSNRLQALKFAKDHWIYGINKQYELGGDTGRAVDSALRMIRKINTYGSLGFPFGTLNVIKNNLQGRLQNLIGSRFGNWSSAKSMRKAAANFKINMAYYLSQADKPLNERGIDFHIISYMNPTLDANIYNNLLKGSTKRVLKEKELMMFNEAMEFSIAVNLLYGHLHHQKVRNEQGETKELYEILEFKEGRLQPKEGFKTVDTNRVVDEKYLLDTKLAYKTVVEYVQGKVGSKTLLSTTTIGQALLYFKNWLIPMLRRRFDKSRPNYMIGEDLEGYWRTFGKLSLMMLRDLTNHGKIYWNTFTEEEKRNYITALQEIAFMVLSLMLISLVLGFDIDDPDKFKKLEQASYAEKMAVLLAVQAKNETEALSAMPLFNLEQSLVPTVLTEGTKWITNPTIGLSIIDNSWKTLNYTYALAFNQDNAYYTKDMPQFGIEKGDAKALHYLLKVAQIDDLLNQFTPEDKLRSVISNMKR